MKLTRRIIKYLTCSMSALCLLSCIAFAHSGGTDADGGHYNRSTGEYHWHHGYSAHQHYDIDGDGVLDCPIEYEAQSSKSASVNGLDDDYGVLGERDAYMFGEANGKSDAKGWLEKNSSSDDESVNKSFAAFGYCAAAVGGAAVCFVASKTIQNRKQHAAEKAKFEAERQAFIEKIGDKRLRDIAGVPPRIRFTNAGYPVDNNDRAFGSYTVYISKSGRCYHQKPGCCSARNAEHFFKAKWIYSPCSKCCTRQMSIPAWYNEYNKLKNEAKRLNISIEE